MLALRIKVGLVVKPLTNGLAARAFMLWMSAPSAKILMRRRSSKKFVLVVERTDQVDLMRGKDDVDGLSEIAALRSREHPGDVPHNYSR